MAEAKVQEEIEVTAKDLPLHCPTNEVALWCSHPRVFLDIAETGHAMCPVSYTHLTLPTNREV